MDWLLRFLLKTFVRRGTFRVTTSSGASFTFGDGTGKPVAVRFATRAAERGILLDPELKFGEAYMDGSFVVEEGSIADVLAIALGQHSDIPHWARPQWLLRYLNRRLQQFNPRRRARKNVAHHYDLDGRLYSLFLDADRQYSCGYFESPDQSLDDAQLAKKRHLAAKLLLAQGKSGKALHVLDIGCGWGGLGLYLAEVAGADVTGITLSQEQHNVANERAAEKGLIGKAQFRAARLPRYRGPLRPHRIGRHVRACRRQSLRHFFPQERAAIGRRWRHGAAFDRPLRRPQHHQPVDRQIYLPGRLYPVAVGGAAADRELQGCW